MRDEPIPRKGNHGGLPLRSSGGFVLLRALSEMVQAESLTVVIR